MTACALYRHFDSAGNLLCVGRSLNPVRRLGEHSSSAPWFQDIASVTVEWFDTIGAAVEAETSAIASESPIQNVVGSVTALDAHMARLKIAPRGKGVSFGQWLKARGITQSAAARTLDQSRSYLSEVCNGLKSPGLRFAILIEDFTGGEITVRDLADFYDAEQGRRVRGLPAATASVTA